jgi:hypothetical protein
LADPIAAGMLIQHAVPQHVAQHAFGAIGRDIGEPVIIILLVPSAQVADAVEKIACKEANAHA